MAQEIRFVVQSFRSGLWKIFSVHPFLTLCSFVVIALISSVIPLAFLWLIHISLFEFSFLSIESTTLKSFVTLWSIIEVCFFFYQLKLYKKIQNQHSPPHLTNAERDRLVSYALSNIRDVKKTMTKWFLDCPFNEIDRESIVGWLAFAFYSKNIDELNSGEHEEINSFINRIEISHQVKPTKLKSETRIAHMKHILDPVRVIFRPFAVYFVTDTILDRSIGRTIFYLKGYQFVRIGDLQFWTYYNSSLKRNPQDEKEPIVFFHGIGAGLLFYQPFISYLHRRFAKNRRLIFISMRCISLRYPKMDEIPNMMETSDSIKKIFEHYQIKKAVFIGHSYGTACLSWIVQKCPECISKLIFLDPICFALFEPYVVYNFVYRTPEKLPNLLMFYFICRELGISYVVSRHFWWTQNNLYLEQIRQCSKENLPVFALLASRDCIINPHFIRDYLEENGIDHYWAKGLLHGAFMYDTKSWHQINQWILA